VLSCAKAEEKSFSDILGLKGRTGARQSSVEWTAALAAEGQPGEIVLRLTATIPPESWIYSMKPGQGPETKIKVTESGGLEEVGKEFAADHAPKVVDDPDLERVVEKYFDKVTWSKRYRTQFGVGLEAITVRGTVSFQVCDTNNCRPGQYKFDVKVTGSAPAAPPQVAGEGAPTQFEQLVGKKGSQTVEGKWRAFVAPSQARRGEEVTVTIEADLKPGWHVYSLDQKQLPDGTGPMPTAIGLTDKGGLVPVDTAFVGPEPKEEPSAWEGLNQRYHEGRIRWSRKFRVSDEQPSGKIPLAGRVAWTMCNSRKCEAATGFEFRGKLTVAGESVASEAAFDVVKKLSVAEAGEAAEVFRSAAAATATQIVNVARPAVAEPASPPLPAREGNSGQPARSLVGEAGVAAPRANPRAQGLPLFLTAAILAGFAALLTPCVFPMVPITVSFFQKQSEQKHHRPVTMASVYCLGIMGTFTGLGMLMSIVFGAGSLNQLSNSVLLNLFIGGVLVFFAFNLLGLFEIRVPSWLLTFTAGKESQGGYVGVLFMALTFTLTSFTCTFAFAGLLLAEATRGDRLWPILGLLAFSAAFSLPFFFLALFPSLLQKLPKSGGWMNVVKVIMALVELGAAFKYFGTADQTWNGEAAIFDFHLMVSAWAVISVAAALYLLGLFRLSHDMPSEHIGVLRFVSAMSFMGLASYLAVGLFSAEKPHGAVWKYVEAFANPNFEGGADRIGPYLKHGRLQYALDFDRALEVAIAENKPLFLDFTGVNCANCRWMEKGPMSQPQIEERLSRFVRIQLFTDALPYVPDRAEAERLRELNAKLQEDWYGDVSLPSYVIIPPDREVLKDRSKILSDLAGKNDAATFADFLDRGWTGWQKIQANRGGRVVGQR
jgi:thiol:disulfide interchange protein DsbD